MDVFGCNKMIQTKEIEEWPVEIPSQAKNRLSLLVRLELFIIRLILSEWAASKNNTKNNTG